MSHHAKQTTSALKIQIWWRQCTLLYKEAQDIGCAQTKSEMVRYYCHYYPTEVLLTYPEFVRHKCNAYNRTLSSMIEHAYMSAQLSDDVSCREKSDVRRFLMHESITKSVIAYTGW
jgi:hypothetical protein